MKTHLKGRPGSPRNQRDGERGPQRNDRRDDGRQGGRGPARRDGAGPIDRGARRARPTTGPRTGGTGGPPRGPRPRPAGKNLAPGISLRGELVYGRNAVRESLRAGRRKAHRLLVAEGVRDDQRVNEIIALAQEQEVLVERVPRPMLDDLARGGNHQGMALDTEEFPYADLEDVIEAEGTVLVLDHLNDPQNFGTLMRAADAAGVAGIVLPADRSVSVTPAVVNASAGAIEHLLVAQTPNLARALDKLEATGRWIVGLDEGDDAQGLFAADIPMPVALVVGAEGSGLSPVVRKRCQMIVEIPMLGRVESLNAATAGSIVLYDLLRRRSVS